MDTIGGSIYGAAPEGVKTIAPSGFEFQTIHGNFAMKDVVARDGSQFRKNTPGKYQ